MEGHQGISKTYDKVMTTQLFWPGKFTETRYYSVDNVTFTSVMGTKEKDGKSTATTDGA